MEVHYKDELARLVVFTTIRDRDFEARLNTDVLGLTLPISSFTAIVKRPTGFTADIVIGNECSLYDDAEEVYFLRGVVVSAEYIGAENEFIRIVAEDIMSVFDNKILPQVTFPSASSLFDIYDATLLEYGSASGVIEMGEIDDTPLGHQVYFPEQTARERLQYLAAAYGYYITTAFPAGLNEFAKIKKCKLISEYDETEYGEDKVFYKPEVKFVEQRSQQGTGVFVEYFAGSEAAGWYPSSGPDGSNNSSVLKGCTAITSAEAMDVQLRLVGYLSFQNATADVQILTDEIKPGDLISFATEKEIVKGFANEIVYKFGKGMKAKVTVTYGHAVSSSRVELLYRKDEATGDVLHRVKKIVERGSVYIITAGAIEKQETEGSVVYVPTPPTTQNTVFGGTASSAKITRTCTVSAATRQIGDELRVYQVDQCTLADGDLTIKGAQA